MARQAIVGPPTNEQHERAVARREASRAVVRARALALCSEEQRGVPQELQLSAAERRASVARANVSLCNLAGCHFFWSPSRRRLYAREARRRIEDCYRPSRGRGGALPADALYIGCYVHGIAARVVLEDLYDTLRRHARSSAVVR